MLIGDAYPSNLFLLSLGKFTVATFQQISQLTYGVNVVEATQLTSSGEIVTRKQPGTKQSGEVTVTRLLDASTHFTDWVDTCMVKHDVVKARQTVIITILDYGKQPVRRIVLKNCWAAEWTSPDLSASSDEAAAEQLKLVYEDVTVSR